MESFSAFVLVSCGSLCTVLRGQRSNCDGTVANDDSGDIVEAVCWSDTVCVHVYTRSPSLGISTVLGSCVLQWCSGRTTSTLPAALRVIQLDHSSRLHCLRRGISYNFTRHFLLSNKICCDVEIRQFLVDDLLGWISNVSVCNVYKTLSFDRSLVSVAMISLLVVLHWSKHTDKLEKEN